MAEKTFKQKSRNLWLVSVSLLLLAGMVYACRGVGPATDGRSDGQLESQTSAGLAAYQKGDFDKAVGALEAATKENPADAKAQRTLGRSYEATGKLNKAIVAYRKSLDSDPKQPEVLYNLAIIYKSQNKPGQAVTYLKKAIAFNKQFTGARLMLAEAYAGQNQTDRAKEQYRAILEMKPFGMDLKDVEAKLQALK